MSKEYMIGYFVGLICAVAVGVGLILLIVKFTKTDKSIKSKYDERQKLVQGTAYKYGFFTMMIVVGIQVITGGFFGADLNMACVGFVDIVLGITVYSNYCIWNNVYFALNENPKRVMIIFAVIGVINLVLAYINISNSVMAAVINLSAALMLIEISAVVGLRKLVDNRTADEDEEEEE